MTDVNGKTMFLSEEVSRALLIVFYKRSGVNPNRSLEPKHILFSVAVTFNISRNMHIIRCLCYMLG